MKQRRDDKRPRNRARDGDTRARDANGGRTRNTPGDRVAQAYKRGDKGRAQRDQSRVERDRPRVERDELHIRHDKSRVGSDERHVDRDQPRVRRDQSRGGRDDYHIDRNQHHIERDESRVRREEPRVRREGSRVSVEEPRVRREEPRVRVEKPRVRRDEQADGAQTFGAHDDNARRPRAEENGAHIFGVQPVLEALRAGARPVERLTLAEGAHESRLREILEIARYADIPVRRVPRTELQRLAAGANHQGVVATIAAAHYTHADELLDALSARVGTNDPPLAVVLDGVEDPRNLGAVLRTTECAGAHGVFVPERRASGLTETVAKAAAGALEYVPVARVANVVRLLEELKGRGVWTVGTAADAEKDYTEWDWTQPSALLLGGEGEGLRRLVRERCDVLVRIPLLGRIESLNVSVAAGIILYEAVRQRRMKKVISDEKEVMSDE
jgi:23S rRNA (guanosine2251-2'-O)-methyltransferase